MTVKPIPDMQDVLVKLGVKAVRLDMRLDALERRVSDIEDGNVNKKQEYARLVKRRGETPRKE